MFDRVVIRVSDLDASVRFYETVLGALGVAGAADGAGTPSGAQVGGDAGSAGGPKVAAEVRYGDLVIAAADEVHPVTTQLHVGLAAPSLDHIERFWRAGVDAGFASDGEPGPRPAYSPEYHGAFLLDPDGNSIEAARHANLRDDGVIDHLWIRVPQVAPYRRFYEAARGQADHALVAEEPDLARFRGPNRGSFTLVAGGAATTGLDMTIGAARFVDPGGGRLALRAAG